MILGVSMSTSTLVHVPCWLSILNISLGSRRPYRRYLSCSRCVGQSEPSFIVSRLIVMTTLIVLGMNPCMNLARS